MTTPWKIWIDTGGTFTDCIATTPAGKVKRLKVLSSSVIRGRIIGIKNSSAILVDTDFPTGIDIYTDFKCIVLTGAQKQFIVNRVDLREKCVYLRGRVDKNMVGKFVQLTTFEEVPVFASRLLTETPVAKRLPEIDLKLGSTKGTNALLERKGARTAFITTKGFKDLLLIRDQQRPDLFTVNIIRPSPLYVEAFELDERIASDGSVLRSLTHSACRELIRILKRKKIESVAIALVNSYKNPAHEHLVREALAKSGFSFVSISSELSSGIRVLPRAETSVANAYLHPVIHSYLSRISSGSGIGKFKVMSSAGGLLESDSFAPKESLLSGPAGGVIGAIHTAKKSGLNKIITFDMGGTSTDVSLSNGRPEYRFESTVGNLKILSPSIAIETIASGGGSICDFDGHRFTVGPHSAGSFPGPACYGAGGPLTITDVNLLLGKLDENKFAIPVRRELAEHALDALLKQIRKRTSKKYDRATVLMAFQQIANEKMAEAIRKVSIQRGYDPSEYALLSFGGAGGQHACSLADILGVARVVVPYDAGLLSAYGIGNAKTELIKEKLTLSSLEDFLRLYDKVFDELRNDGVSDLVDTGLSAAEVVVAERMIFARLKGQDTSIEIQSDNPDDVARNFRSSYKKIYGYWIEGREIEIESVRLRLEVKSNVEITSATRARKHVPTASKSQKAFVFNRWVDVQVFEWEKLKPGATIVGPAIIASNNSTQFVETGWMFTLDTNNNALLDKLAASATNTISAEEAQLELFTNRFTAIALNMGAMLQRTAFSVNVKERLDFSCALLDANGNLVVNAPHIPVHLGSLGVCVRALERNIEMKEGDVVITNHPAYGGSHLPDITLVKPVYHKSALIGFVANRAHHAEIGGVKPGSTPAHATLLREEGVIIPPTYLIRKGKPRWEAVESILVNGDYPTRNVAENLSDLRAALAALILGATELGLMCDQYSRKLVTHFMQKITDYSASLMQGRIKQLSGRTFKALEQLDDGSRLSVKFAFKARSLVVDFSGSSSMHPGNLNATEAIVRSVLVYVLRLLVGKPIPLNEGLVRDVKVILPKGLLNPEFLSDEECVAVVGGNTEVSQRLTDTLIKALKLASCSQGTMNNFLFGDDGFGYYETIGGGTGAGKGFSGADAVHQHMTNTRITDVEILEWRYPAMIKKFAVRKGSGGKGKYRGGDGIVREIEFGKKLEVNILSQHRVVAPYGLNGGGPGATGSQTLIRANGERISLQGIDSVQVSKGDSIIIKTPGGGAWGKLP